jgi:hypothetical protein
MAPELLVKDLRLREASLTDMINADIWAYGMVVFNIINPGLKHPYENNLENCCAGDAPLHVLQRFAKENVMPVAQPKYALRQKEEWAGLKKIYETCATISPSSRPSMTEVFKLVQAERKSTTITSSLQRNSMDVHLKVSQATAISNVDQELQKEQENVGDQDIQDDATNACAFLTVLMAHELHEANEMSWDDLVTTVESIIVTEPHVFNRFRDVYQYYDVVEAYTLLKINNCLPDRYAFTEELPYKDGALSEIGKERLLKAMTAVASQCPSFGFFTCEKFIFLIGSYNSDMFVLDTHEVPVTAEGRCTALLKRFSGANENSAEECCKWLWNRLASSKLSGPLSLSMMIKHNLKR